MKGKIDGRAEEGEPFPGDLHKQLNAFKKQVDILTSVFDSEFEEWHYYISSRTLTSLELLHHAQMQWAVESMHWILDVHYSEDFCRIVNRTIQQNLNMLRKFALSLIRQFKTDSNSKRPLSQIMFNCLLNPSDICTILEN